MPRTAPLPTALQLNQRLVFVEEKDGESHQFISAAADGTVRGGGEMGEGK